MCGCDPPTPKKIALCGGRFFLGVGGWNIERKGGYRSALPCVPPLSLCRSNSGSFSLPLWLSPPPPLGAAQTLWNNMSVGACFLPRKKITVKGASHGFATLPLTVIFLCGFTETPTEQNVQRACSRHEPTQGGS